MYRLVEALGSPVLAWELKRAARGYFWRFFPLGYSAWLLLLAVAQSFREITNGKMWGILQATVPFVIAFALPVCLLGAVGGPNALCVAAMWILVPCAAVFGAALMGIDMMHVPRDMDETRQGGAFGFENRRRERKSRSGKGGGMN
jgi:hypothetical protein